MNNKQRILVGAIIFCTLLAISFRITSKETIWLWSNLPFISIILILSAFFFAWLWIKIEQKRQEERIRQIRKKNETEISQHRFLDLLSEREKDVFKKIIEGKANKEIADELNIAVSTVKTHINNIYKILKVANREELKKIANQ